MEFLLVDDDRIARLALSNIVRGIDGAGGVLESQDGEQAWDLLQAGLRPALCCCDIRMPRLDGLGFLQRVRQHPVLRHVPVVLITSASDRETLRTAIQGGAAGYILKPFLAQQTRATLVRVLGERLATESEPPHATLRRLAIDAARLRDLLDALRADALAARDGPGHPEQVQRLHGTAVRLGQWRGAGLLHEMLERGQGDDGLRVQVLDEVVRLVERQRRGVEDRPAGAHGLPAKDTDFLPRPSATPGRAPFPAIVVRPAVGGPDAYERDTLARQFGGMTTLFQKARCMFLDQAPADLRAISEAASRGDAASTRAIAHKLKGSAGTVGAAMLAKLCEPLAAGTGEPGADWIAHAQAALEAYRAESVGGAAG